MELAQLLLPAVSNVDAGTRPDAALGERGTAFNLTALHLACESGNVAMVEALLKHGASRVCRDSRQMTPLHFAAALGFPECVALLLGPSGARKMSVQEVSAENRQGSTALSMAARGNEISGAGERQRAECVRLILEAGADANTSDRMGHSPLMVAALAGRRGALIARALVPFSDLASKDVNGHTAFHIAVGVNNEDVFRVLLPHYDVDVRTVRGDREGNKLLHFNQTALHVSCLKGLHSIAATLLKLGASRTAEDSSGWTPLHVAAAAGQLGCAILMVGWPGKPEMLPSLVDLRDLKGSTALHIAANTESVKICGVLIGAGARLNADVHGYTPLTIAQEDHPTNKDLIALLSGKVLAGKLPGTVCAACGETAALFCPACGNEVYCSAECMQAAIAGHTAACKARQSELEDVTRVRQDG